LFKKDLTAGTPDSLLGVTELILGKTRFC